MRNLEAQPKANIQISKYPISFMNWKKWKSPIRATLANPNFEFKDEMKNVVSHFEFHN